MHARVFAGISQTDSEHESEYIYCAEENLLARNKFSRAGKMIYTDDNCCIGNPRRGVLKMFAGDFVLIYGTMKKQDYRNFTSEPQIDF